MLAYRKRNTFLQMLHPLSGVLIFILYLTAILIINNPIYLSVIFFSLILLSYVDGCLFDIFIYMKIIIPFVVLIVLFNPIISHNGATVLIRTNINMPVFGQLIITLEALLYGFFMAYRLLMLTYVFGFGNMILHPDRTFTFFSKYLKRSALLMSMITRFFPTLMNSYINIIETEKLRGNIPDEGGMLNRIKSKGSTVNILFQSSIEDAVDISESMYSRGYGSGKRSAYFKEKFYTADWFVLVYSIIQFSLFFYLVSKGQNTMNFYPSISNPMHQVTVPGIFFAVMFLIPFVGNWGWNIWKR